MSTIVGKVMSIDKIIVFPWNQNFETGIEKVDLQHKKLVELINKLANILFLDDEIELSNILDELFDYASFHFKDEEQIWNEYFTFDDNWFSLHLLSHNSFLPSVVKIKDHKAEKPWQNQAEILLKFLIRWLAFHILDEDKKMSYVVQEIEKGLSLNDAKYIAEEKMKSSYRFLIAFLSILS